MQQYGRPVILFHLTKDGLAKGSCRSIPAFNMFDALASCEDLLLSFGGHACAAGLSLREADVAELKRRMEALVSAQLSMDDLVLSLSVDAPVTLRDLNYQFMGQVQRMEPFGNANPEPVFVIEGVTLVQEPRLLKDKHVRCMVFSEGILKSVLFFNRPELYQPLCVQGDKPFTIAVHITSNEWQGKTTIELQGIDISF
jgi:single-stranded-DNA-specific exonuclease